MPVVLILFGAILIVCAYRNTVGELGQAMASDIPNFSRWFGALALTGAIGFIPGLQIPSRYLLALVLLALFLRNYSAILSGLTGISTASAAPSSVPTPAESYAANPAAPNVTQASIDGLGQPATAAALAVGTAGGFGTTVQSVAQIAQLAHQLGGAFG